jgi:glycosyltransferase involved in cell wall biosynthesis
MAYMENKKNLLIINGAQFGHSSGHYFYCKYLSESYTVNYICYDRGLKRMDLKDVNVYYISFSGNKLIRSLRFIKDCIRYSYLKRPDIIIITYFNYCFLLGIFCCSKKTILDIRTGSLNRNRLLRSIENIVILFKSWFFNGIIILSDSLRKKLKINEKKCNIVPLGSEIYFAGDHSYNTLNLLYVGVFDDRNIGKTIDGLHLFLQRNTRNAIEITYTIIGFGSDIEIQKILDNISDYKMSDVVKYEGRKSLEELAPYFEKSNIGIVFVPQTPGYDYQPVTKLFEYTLSGMPVIATNTYENRLIVNKSNGVLINDSSEDFCIGLERIYNNRNSYNSSAIRKSVENNTWENIVNTNLKPYLLDLLR